MPSREALQAASFARLPATRFRASTQTNALAAVVRQTRDVRQSVRETLGRDRVARASTIKLRKSSGAARTTTGGGGGVVDGDRLGRRA
jgi:hypothetical protein